MTNEQLIIELETAAGYILAPPNLVSSEQRHSAQSIFMNFRESKSPYGICREILEKSRNDFVLFESAEVLKHAIIREWTFLQDSDRASLRQYLLQYITNREVPAYVRDRILQVIAIMVKRASVDDNGLDRGAILQEVENLIVNGEPQKKILGCNIIIVLMQEYASTVKSTDVGLPWEVHFKAKKQFEATDLKRIFQFCIYLLSEAVQADAPFSDSVVQLIGYLVRIAENVLSWGYVSPLLPKRLIGIFESVFESDQAPALKLTTSWSEVIFNPDLLPLMFQIYWKVREHEQLAHHSMACLVQLASLSGAIFVNDSDRETYLKSYLTTFLNLLTNLAIRSQESLGISNIVRKLTLFYIHEIVKLPENMIDTILDEFSRLTCSFCDGAAIEDAQFDENKFFNDAFDNMLEAWATILQEFTGNVDNNIRKYSVAVFNKFVQSHLAPPDGSRQCINNQSDDVEDNEGSDRIKYREQLQTIGMFGRCVPGHALPVIYKLLENRIEKLVSHIKSMENRAMTMDESEVLDNLFEDVHWIILIGGHVLCMDSDGETPMIPTEIMQYSIDQCNHNQSTLPATINALVAAESKIASPDNIEQCDHIIRIVYNVMKLCAVEDFAVSIKLGHFLSPEVGCSIMWFIKRWCLSYLLPIENFYSEISPTLIGSLGKDTECAKMVVSYVLSKVQSNIFYFQSEPVLLNDTIELFCEIVCVKQKSTHIVRTESMRNLIRFHEQLRPGILPPNILRGLCKGFILAGSALTNPSEMTSYYAMILSPVQNRFKNVLAQEDFNRSGHKEEFQNILIDILECFIGIAKGALMNTVEVLFQFLAPILSELPAVLNVYNSYQIIVQLILELFGQVAKYMLCYLTPLDSRRLYDSSMAVVQMYAKCNTNRLSNETFAEESSFQDLVLVLDLLTFILSKDCIDLCTNANVVEIDITASDVSLYGLTFVMPLMTLDLLKYPSLCGQYYRLLVLINDIYPEKICNLPTQMMQTLLRSIELGFTKFGSDIVQACMDFVQGMASYIYKNGMLHTDFAAALKPFLELIMTLTLTHQINSDLMTTAGTTIYALICCYPNEYQVLVQNLIQRQTDTLVADRLATAFNNLTNTIEMTCERQPKLKFRDNFDKFIANVHGFLLTK